MKENGKSCHYLRQKRIEWSSHSFLNPISNETKAGNIRQLRVKLECTSHGGFLQLSFFWQVEIFDVLQCFGAMFPLSRLCRSPRMLLQWASRLEGLPLIVLQVSSWDHLKLPKPGIVRERGHHYADKDTEKLVLDKKQKIFSFSSQYVKVDTENESCATK